MLSLTTSAVLVSPIQTAATLPVLLLSLPAGDWPQPHLRGAEAPGGPVMVTVEYWPRPGLEDKFLAVLSPERSRAPLRCWWSEPLSVRRTTR
jgi:hypothetical protein